MSPDQILSVLDPTSFEINFLARVGQNGTLVRAEGAHASVLVEGGAYFGTRRPLKNNPSWHVPGPLHSGPDL